MLTFEIIELCCFCDAEFVDIAVPIQQTGQPVNDRLHNIFGIVRVQHILKLLPRDGTVRRMGTILIDNHTDFGLFSW